MLIIIVIMESTRKTIPLLTDFKRSCTKADITRQHISLYYYFRASPDPGLLLKKYLSSLLLIWEAVAPKTMPPILDHRFQDADITFTYIGLLHLYDFFEGHHNLVYYRQPIYIL